MKRILTFLLVTLMTIGAWAQHWTLPSGVGYKLETQAILQVNVDKVPFAGTKTALEVAAFIDGTVRGVGALRQLNGTPLYQLRVNGNDADLGKKIVFKAYYSGIEYEFTQTATFQENAITPVPFVVELDLFGGLKLPQSQEYETTTLPYQFSLDDLVSVKYVNAQGKEVIAQGKSKITTNINYDWSTNGSNSILPLEGSTSGDFYAQFYCENERLTVTARGDDGGSIGSSADILVTVKQGNVPVTSIDCSKTEMDILLPTSEKEVMDRLGNSVIVGPQNATNQDWTLQPVDPEKDMFAEDAQPGTYVYKIVSSDNEQIYTTITFNAWLYPEYVTVENNPLYINVDYKSDVQTKVTESDLFGGASTESITSQDVIDEGVIKGAGIKVMPTGAYDKLDIEPVYAGAFLKSYYGYFFYNSLGEYPYTYTSKATNNVTGTFSIILYRAVQSISDIADMVRPVGVTAKEVFAECGATVLPSDATYQDLVLLDADDKELSLATVFDTPGVYTLKVKLKKDPTGQVAAKAFKLTILGELISMEAKPGIKKDEEGRPYIMIDTPKITMNLADVLPALVLLNPEDVYDPQLAVRVIEDTYLDGISKDGIVYSFGEPKVYTAHVYSKRYPNVAPVVFRVAIGHQFDFVGNEKEPIVLSKYYSTLVTITCDRAIDPELIRVVGGNSDSGAAIVAEPADETGLKWNVRAVNFTDMPGVLHIEYDGSERWTPSRDYVVKGEMPLKKGWDWFSPTVGISCEVEKDGDYYSGIRVPFDECVPFENDNGRIVEIRSQTDLLYNDKNLGVIGSMDAFQFIDGMYKIKTESTSDVYGYINVGTDYDFAVYCAGKPISLVGYNWIGYNGLYIKKFANMASNEWGYCNIYYDAEDGDRIIGKEGFAEYSKDATGKGTWTCSDGFLLEPGKGYMYYTETPKNVGIEYEGISYWDLDSEEMQLNGIPTNGDGVAGAKQMRVAKKQVFDYDASQFADNMTMVAQIAGMEGDENITIGAFVNGECRGKGSFSKGNLMFINVAGKTGEEVTFKLYDHDADSYYEINETVTYNTMVGSLKAPVALSSDATITGINSIKAPEAAQGMYDLSGRRVNTADKRGVYIVNGKKVLK